MEKICLIQAGRFLIGIDAALIRATRPIGSYAAKGDTPLLHLESFFGQQSLEAEVGNVLELADGSELPALLIDRVIGEIDAPIRFEPLPLLYPELAATCCPQIFVDEQQVYLLLDVEKIEPVHEQLQTDYGFVLFSELPAVVNNKVETAYVEPFVEARVEPVVVEDPVKHKQPEEQDEEMQDSIIEDEPLSETDDENEEQAESTSDIADFAPEEEISTPDNRLSAGADDKIEEENVEPLVDEKVEPADAAEEAVTQSEERDEEKESQDLVIEEVTLVDTGDKGEEQTELTATVEDSPPEEEGSSPGNMDDSSAKQENTQPLTEISDEILQKIVFWTIGQYIDRDQNEKAVINATDLPLAFVQPQGVSLVNVQVRRDTIQHIINKTVWRCEQLDEASLRQLQKKYGNS